MNCLRCGRETEEQQVFCKACLDNMARHPVKSDTPIYLPVRKTNEPPKKQYFWPRKERSLEEAVVILRKRVRFLTALSLILFMMLSAAAAGVWFARKQAADLAAADKNQNFSIVTDILGGGKEE